MSAYRLSDGERWDARVGLTVGRSCASFVAPETRAQMDGSCLSPLFYVQPRISAPRVSEPLAGRLDSLRRGWSARINNYDVDLSRNEDELAGWNLADKHPNPTHEDADALTENDVRV